MNYNNRIFSKNESETTKKLRSKQWKVFRQSILIRDNAECKRCLIKLHIHTYNNLEIHHIKPREKYPELMYEPTNVVTLCKSCNAHLGLSGIDFDFKPSQLEDIHI